MQKLSRFMVFGTIIFAWTKFRKWEKIWFFFSIFSNFSFFVKNAEIYIIPLHFCFLFPKFIKTYCLWAWLYMIKTTMYLLIISIHLSCLERGLFLGIKIYFRLKKPSRSMILFWNSQRQNLPRKKGQNSIQQIIKYFVCFAFLEYHQVVV